MAKILTPEQVELMRHSGGFKELHYVDGWPKIEAIQKLCDSHEALRAQITEAQADVRALAEAGDALLWQIGRGRYVAAAEVREATSVLRAAQNRPGVRRVLEFPSAD